MLSLVLLVVPGHAWLDAASNFFLLYAYSTMTLREHILRLNGSTMQVWWIWHHYLCVGLAGLLVVWPAGPTYAAMRTHLLLFMVYIAAVQILQYRYQMNRLYTLRALSRVSAMQTTTESASVHIFNSLGFLLPLLLLGHVLCSGRRPSLANLQVSLHIAMAILHVLPVLSIVPPASASGWRVAVGGNRRTVWLHWIREH